MTNPATDWIGPTAVRRVPLTPSPSPPRGEGSRANPSPPTRGEGSLRSRSSRLCMIVKNEEHNLGACLASAAGLAGDIVVADTVAAQHHRRPCPAVSAASGAGAIASTNRSCRACASWAATCAGRNVVIHHTGYQDPALRQRKLRGERVAGGHVSRSHHFKLTSTPSSTPRLSNATSRRSPLRTDQCSSFIVSWPSSVAVPCAISRNMSSQR